MNQLDKEMLHHFLLADLGNLPMFVKFGERLHKCGSQTSNSKPHM